MKHTTRFPDEILKYKGEWVALSLDGQQVLGHGLKIKQAREMADRNSDRRSVMLFVPEKMPDILVL